jgi:hypothetical protein
MPCAPRVTITVFRAFVISKLFLPTALYTITLQAGPNVLPINSGREPAIFRGFLEDDHLHNNRLQWPQRFSPIAPIHHFVF